MTAVFDIKKPDHANRLPLVFDSPHSGRNYPDDFTYACPFDELIRAEDNRVDELFDMVDQYGGTLISALFPRTYIDVNRAEDDIDYELLAERRPHSHINKGRSHAGIGLIRRLLRPGIPVYNRKLDLEEVNRRIENFYRPYHTALSELLEQAHYDFGKVWHIDCHSMPSGLGRRIPSALLSSQPDFVLGDRDGTSCDLSFRDAIKTYLTNLGYRVAINDPYKGVEILRRYGKPAKGFNSLQLEINKNLYWDEINNTRSPQFNVLRQNIEKLVSFCAAWVAEELNQRLAAD